MVTEPRSGECLLDTGPRQTVHAPHLPRMPHVQWAQLAKMNDNCGR